MLALRGERFLDPRHRHLQGDGSVRRVANSSDWSVSVVTPPQAGQTSAAFSRSVSQNGQVQ